MDHRDKIAAHIASVMRGEHPDNQDNQFAQWIDNEDLPVDVLARLTDKEYLEVAMNSYKNSETLKKQQTKILLEKINRERLRRRVRKIVSWSGVAAMILLGCWVTYMVNRQENYNRPVVENVVRLVLADGSVLAIHDLNNSETFGPVRLLKEGNHEVKYLSAENSGDSDVWNEFIVPHGHYYKIVLDDGSSVTLNAESSIRFPKRFAGNCREVSIKGECYFEVVKDSCRPFRVQAGTAKVEVYGTRFNINAYDTLKIETTLVEGSVGIGIADHRMYQMLPDQLAICDAAEGTTTITDLEDCERYIAWTANQFVFFATPLDRVIDDLTRWYGVTFQYDSGSDVLITASYNRDTPLAEIKRSIERLSGIQLTIK